MQQRTDARIILVGKTGQGKSSIGNKICHSDAFKVGTTMVSETTQIATTNFTWPYNNGLQVSLIDTPGLADNRKKANLTDEQIISNIREFMNELTKGFNIGLFCWEAKSRFEAHDLNELVTIIDLLGQGVFHHLWICVTQLDKLIPEEQIKIKENASSNLAEIFAENEIDFPADQLLFSDFKNFESSIMKPLDVILRKNQKYFPPKALHPIYQYLDSQLKIMAKDEKILQERLDKEKLPGVKRQVSGDLDFIASRKAAFEQYLKNPYVFLDLSVDDNPIGTIELTLLADSLPKAAENFRALCTGERKIGYKGTSFFSVGDLWAQGGINETIYGGPFPCEKKVKRNECYTLSMVLNGGKVTSGFLIAFNTLPDDIEEQVCAVGKVLNGLEIIRRLQNLGTPSGKIQHKITITNCGQHW